MISTNILCKINKIVLIKFLIIIYINRSVPRTSIRNTSSTYKHIKTQLAITAQGIVTSNCNKTRSRR